MEAENSLRYLACSGEDFGKIPYLDGSWDSKALARLQIADILTAAKKAASKLSRPRRMLML